MAIWFFWGRNVALPESSNPGITATITTVTASTTSAAASTAPSATQTESTLPTEITHNTPVLRSVTVTDSDVAPLLPEGMSVHFLSGNRMKVGYVGIPFKPTVNCGVTMGQLWISGIPSWLDLTMIDKNVYSYVSYWMPAWSFQIDDSGSYGGTILPQNEQTASVTRPYFDWSGIVTEGAKVDFQVARDASFSDIILSRVASWDSGYTLSADEALLPGTYYWRVREYGKFWFISLPVWLNLAKYDPSLTGLPVFTAINTADGQATLSYIAQ